MVLYPVGRADEFKELEPVFVDVKGIKIGVYRFRDKFYAYANRCPHQGGPACEGLAVGRVVCDVTPEGRAARTYASTDRFNIVCPWHAYEFDLQTGRCQGNPRIGLAKFNVVAQDGQVSVSL